MKTGTRRIRSPATLLDMDKAVAKCARMLNDHGMAVFVIGNTQYRNVKIDNAKCTWRTA